MKHRLIVAEEHALLRQGLSSMLSQQDDLDVVAQAADGKEAVHLTVMHAGGLLLTNLALPGLTGVEAARLLKRRNSAVKVVGRANTSSQDFIRAALSAGVDGLVSAEAGFEEILAAIRGVLRGQKFVSPELSNQLVETLLHGNSDAQHRSPWEVLTSRERSILKLVAEGRTNRRTAEFLSVSPKTVEKHRASLMRKLKLRNATELVLLAVDMGLVARPGHSHCVSPATVGQSVETSADELEASLCGSAMYSLSAAATT